MNSRLWIPGLLAVSLVLVGCPDKRRPVGSPSAKPASATPAKPAEGAKAPAAKGPLADYAHNLSDSEKKATEVTGLAELNQAVKQYNVIEGRFPRTLDELVASRYLPKLPPAPRGKRFSYDAKAGEVTVTDAPAAPAAEAPAPAPEKPAEPAQ